MEYSGKLSIPEFTTQAEWDKWVAENINPDLMGYCDDSPEGGVCECGEAVKSCNCGLISDLPEPGETADGGGVL